MGSSAEAALYSRAGAFVIAERFIYMRERLVRVEAVGVGLYRQLEFFFGAVEIAFFEQIFSFV